MPCGLRLSELNQWRASSLLSLQTWSCLPPAACVESASSLSIRFKAFVPRRIVLIFRLLIRQMRFSPWGKAGWTQESLPLAWTPATENPTIQPAIRFHPMRNVEGSRSSAKSTRLSPLAIPDQGDHLSKDCPVSTPDGLCAFSGVRIASGSPTEFSIHTSHSRIPPTRYSTTLRPSNIGDKMNIPAGLAVQVSYIIGSRVQIGSARPVRAS
jgi:hypothetical protein